MDDIFTEIQEDLQREKLLKFWNAYYQYIIGAAVALIVGAAGWTYWSYRQQTVLARDALSYSQALKSIHENKIAQALSQLQSLAISGGAPTYKALADLVRASLLLDEASKGVNAAATARRQEAVAIYAQMRKNSGIDGKLRDLALLLSVYARLDHEDPRELQKALRPLASASHHPWHSLALELQALLYSKIGDVKSAATLYEDLTKTQGIPMGVRQRAHIMKLRLENQ